MSDYDPAWTHATHWLVWLLLPFLLVAAIDWRVALIAAVVLWGGAWIIYRRMYRGIE